MSGALMQLVAFGAQDAYLFGNPQISFFKLVYRRHTNFATEVSEIAFNSGNNNIGGGKHTVIIQRNGDLVMQMYLHATVGAIRGVSDGGVAWCRRLGHALIKSVEVDIGGAKIDKQYGTWMDIWYELTHTATMEKGYRRMIGDVPELTELSFGSPISDSSDEKIFKDQYTLFVPLQFWFCRNPGLALPLIALQYHEVKLDFEFRDAKELLCYTTQFNTDLIKNMTFQDINLLVNYVYLDSDERRKFAQNGHEYLIEQLQFTGAYNVPVSTVLTNQKVVQNIDLNFNHPTKELIWAMKNGNYNSGQKFLGYTGSDDWEKGIEYAAYNVVNHAFVVNSQSLYPSYASIWQKWLNLADGSYDTLFSLPEFTEIYQPVYAGLNILFTSRGHPIKCVVNTTDAATSAFSAYGGAIGFFYKNCAKIGTYDILDLIDEVEIDFTVDAAETTSTDASTFTTTGIYAIVKPIKHRLTIRDISIPVSKLPGHWQDFKVPNKFTNYADVIVWNHTNYGLLIDGTLNPVDDVVIQFNGHDRFDRREGAYFNYIQPYEHHTRTPADGINVYSFALNPEQFQPSGTANLSRIDSLRINLNYLDPSIPQGSSYHPSLSAFSANSKLYVYDLNYNVLRILSGMGGLAYSN